MTVTIKCVATEACPLLARRIQSDAALDFLRWCRDPEVNLLQA